jgi:hypothetical protein
MPLSQEAQGAPSAPPPTASIPSTPLPSPWAPPPSLASSTRVDLSTTATPSTLTDKKFGTDTQEEQSLFSPTLKEFISEPLQENPFKIRKVGEVDSSTNLAAVPFESKVIPETHTTTSVEAKTVDDQKSRLVEEIADDSSSLSASLTSSTTELEQAEELEDGHSVDKFVADLKKHSVEEENEAEQQKDAIPESEPEAQAEPEANTESASHAAASPAGPRGKFGTKTGLAAKRKATEGSEEQTERNDVVFLLKSADFFSADELEDAIVDSLRDQNKAIEILGILGIIDKSNLDAAVRLQKLVKAGSVDVTKAIEALTDLKSGKLRASELTGQLGIKKPKRRK